MIGNGSNTGVSAWQVGLSGFEMRGELVHSRGKVKLFDEKLAGTLTKYFRETGKDKHNFLHDILK